MKDRTKHNEFLEKLANLMQQYHAEITANYNEGCECCGGEYEISFETGGGSSGIPIVRSYYSSKYVYCESVRSMIE